MSSSHTNTTPNTADLTPAERLANWQAAEAALRGIQRPGPGVARPHEVANKTGLEVMRAMIAGELPAPPISQTLDFVLIEVDHGVAVFQGTPSAKLLNPLGTMHGGWYATLLDSAVGCAVHTALPAGRGYTTLELKLNIVRAVSLDVPLVRAEGRVIHAGRQVATAEGKLVDAAGRLYAHATTTCLVFDAKF
jgi:uncharacterized protein (TIGR00369 family)